MNSHSLAQKLVSQSCADRENAWSQLSVNVSTFSPLVRLVASDPQLWFRSGDYTRKLLCLDLQHISKVLDFLEFPIVPGRGDSRFRDSRVESDPRMARSNARMAMMYALQSLLKENCTDEKTAQIAISLIRERLVRQASKDENSFGSLGLDQITGYESATDFFDPFSSNQRVSLLNLCRDGLRFCIFNHRAQENNPEYFKSTYFPTRACLQDRSWGPVRAITEFIPPHWNHSKLIYDSRGDSHTLTMIRDEQFRIIPELNVENC